MNAGLWRIALRVVALAIVIAAVIDPTIASMRSMRPIISVVSANDSRDSVLLVDATRALQSSFTVVRAPLSAAAGTVLVGAQLPAQSAAIASPVLVLSASEREPSVRMQRIMAPTRAMSNARVPVSARIIVSIPRATRNASTPSASLPDSTTKGTPVRVQVELLHDAAIVARTQFAVSHDTVRSVQLDMVPTRARATVLQLRAFVVGAHDTVRHDVMVDVQDVRWSILFFDRRPSWMSTFVRRALTRDPRFAVTSRVVTSTNVSRATGRAPVGLDELANTSRFDAVVIGAPDALTIRDADGVSNLLRARGASVLVLADHAAPSPLDALLAIGGWTMTTRRVASSIVPPVPSNAVVSNVAGDAMLLKALSIGVPKQLSTSAQILGVVRDSAKSLSARDLLPVIWRMPVGIGQLYVSGAFDAWRFRDSAQSTFDATWRDIVDQAASAHQSALDLRLESGLVRPDEPMFVQLTPRDSSRANSSPGTAEVIIRPLRRDADTSSVATGSIAPPTRPVGASVTTRLTVSQQLSASYHAPAIPGAYELVASLGPDTARQSFVVEPSVSRDADDAPDIVNAWAESRGGRSLSQDHLDSLPATMRQLIHPADRLTSWHPMRSPWWIVPFALALAGEWWLRRRRGLA